MHEEEELDTGSRLNVMTSVQSRERKPKSQLTPARASYIEVDRVHEEAHLRHPRQTILYPAIGPVGAQARGDIHNLSTGRGVLHVGFRVEGKLECNIFSNIVLPNLIQSPLQEVYTCEAVGYKQLACQRKAYGSRCPSGRQGYVWISRAKP